MNAQQGKQLDGPYVSHFGKNISVRTVVQTADSFRIDKRDYSDPSRIKLLCSVSETGDQFSFKLKKEIIVPAEEYKMPAKIFVISDIHANFKGFKSILKGAGVIDDKLSWKFGKGHFVIDGDIFDRGENPTECLWLIYKLEHEAEKAGGKVHYILGNHELMNMANDIRYVNKRILRFYPSMEKEYKNLFNTETELGRWLRSKNVIEKIGSYIFVHAGLSPALDSSGLKINDINKIVRSCIGLAKDKISGRDEKIVSSGKIGPYWFRGLVLNPIPEANLNLILNHFKADRIIVGHTIIDNISSFYGGKVVAINEDHQKNSDAGFMHGLLIEKNKFYIIDNKGIKKDISTK
jgi:hypothetical protein